MKTYKNLVSGGGWWLGCNNSNGMEYGVTLKGGSYYGVRWIFTEGSLDVNDGRWHHIVGVNDGSKVYSYVDGILEDFEGSGGNMESYDSPVSIGGSPHPDQHWNGLIDDVRIYSYALNPEEVKMLYEGKEPPREKRSDEDN